ncbi:GGDEF domain-containing protein [Aestuariirhabdus sp. Z084]|nr:GGDEF domain-containing protein [Aestuariirhabdus haliotis]MCL6421030.1 GGDEF domain-containing protein [Aestuariirhabdus haliotis]
MKLFTAPHTLGLANQALKNRKSLQEQLNERLSRRLQTTLDLEQQLSLFFQELNSALNIDGIEYRHGTEAIELTLGRRSAHSCSYRLLTEKDFNGEISFSRRQRFNEDELQLIESTLGQLVYPLRNALSYRQAIQLSLTDPLTGAGNRIAMDNALRRELQVCSRSKQPLSLLIMDLDHFKAINDSYGHNAGDHVLKHAVDCARQAIRDVDMLFRFGGEEFVILLGDSGLENSAMVAERIRSQIESMQCHFQGEEIAVTASIGVATYNGNEHINDTLQRADQALYTAKREGRNRISTLCTAS